MNWNDKQITPCDTCGASVRIPHKQASDAIIALGKGPLCPECFKRVRDGFTVVEEVARVAW